MEQKLKTDFDKFISTSNFSNQEIKLKKQALDNFLKNGFPSRKLENWKFSDINQIIQKNIGELVFYNNYNIENEVNDDIFIKEIEHNKIVIINGKVERLSFEYEESDKINLTTLDNFNQNPNEDNSLLSLNNSFSNKIRNILVKKNYSFKKPLIIYQITNEKVSNTNINFQLNFELEENSSINIINLSDDNSEKNFINNLYNFNLSKNAILKNYKIDKKNNTNIKYDYSSIIQKENSISETFIFSSGSDYVKNEVNCYLEGKYSSAFINGIHLLSKNKNHEIRTKTNHLYENTKSYQLIKSVIDDSSKSVYQGKIYVNSKAQKTDGYQLSKAVLLNEQAEFNAKPELEIYADDVKCSHGSTSGSLDEDSIFYLMSRGLDQKTAKELLINGFLLDVVEKITDEEIKKLIKNIIGLN
ncbi:Fe-S cluster assembly protein SufD [Pelagibacteraceae bacterium GOM-A1]|nr:Fe-S cluster assembly protein SufD [Pelagibacteraceae bacterium GOM-A1]